MFVRAIPLIAIIFLSVGMSARAEPSPTDLDPLIGEWEAGPADGAPAFIQRFEWGPAKSYIRAKTSLLNSDGSEHVHLDGIVIWNARDAAHDYLFAVEPGSLAQEKGEFRRDDAGVIVRSVELTKADGSTAEFRQTFMPAADGSMATALQRKTASGWEPTFPGSDNLIMRKRG